MILERQGIGLNDEKIKAVQSLKTSRGQIDGIIKMIEDDRYCIDVSNQIMAAQSLLKKANILILKQHINHCVKTAIRDGSEETGEQKIQEIITLLEKLI